MNMRVKTIGALGTPPQAPTNIFATYQSPAPITETSVLNVMTVQFPEGTDAPMQPTYATLRKQVRWGLPIAFALGWAGGYLAWVAIGRYSKKR